MYKYVISLGEDCFMRSLIDRFQIREKFKIRMPFDGSVHSYEDVCDLISTNFINYKTNITNYKDFNNIFIKKSINTITWNHEKTTDLESLIIQLDKRVDQFRNILNSGEKILFLLHYKNATLEFNYNLLEDALKIHYPNLQYHILVFNNYHQHDYISQHENKTYANIFWNSTNIDSTKIPIDFDYDKLNDDFVNQMYITPYGKEFSIKVLKIICYVLQEDPSTYLKKFDINYNFNDNLH
jgi:hypothetical protein